MFNKHFAKIAPKYKFTKLYIKKIWFYSQSETASEGIADSHTQLLSNNDLHFN